MAQSLFSVVVLTRTEIYRSELIARRDGASPRGRFKSNDISSPLALIVHRFLETDVLRKLPQKYLITF